MRHVVPEVAAQRLDQQTLKIKDRRLIDDRGQGWKTEQDLEGALLLHAIPLLRAGLDAHALEQHAEGMLELGQKHVHRGDVVAPHAQEEPLGDRLLAAWRDERAAVGEEPKLLIRDDVLLLDHGTRTIDEDGVHLLGDERGLDDPGAEGVVCAGQEWPGRRFDAPMPIKGNPREPPLTKGDRAKYRYVQEYSGTVAMTRDALKRVVSARRFLRNELKEVRLYSILSPTDRFTRTITLHNLHISDVDAIALFRDAKDEDETQRGEEEPGSPQDRGWCG